MEIVAGSRLGPYEIVSRIGVGGMGEVWRARDTRLDREVAIKVLPPDLANDSALKKRFQREAQMVSQLAHPNICTLFDVGENYLVMELLDGETLADRIARGPLAYEDVLRYGVQIADALDKAHRQHVIHRDLKPGNVMLTKSGAKLLDFGLAKSERQAFDAAGKTPNRSLTQEGTIIGTFQYMAPEQLEGGKADARTDIFAFGAVLYEMITGKPAFDAASNMSLIAKIVAGEPPPITSVKPLVPPALERVIRKCMAKDPDDRWQSARDVGDELRWIATAGPSAGLAAGSRIKQWMRTAAMAAGWLMAGIAIVAAAWFAHRAGERRPLSVEIQPPRNAEFAHQSSGPPTVSPNGSRLAFLAGAETGGMPSGLVIRDLATGSNKSLDGTAGASFPFWSPDGKSLGFFADKKIKAVNVDDGASRIICDAANGRGASWGSTGTIIFAPDINQPLHRVAAAGGKSVPLTRLASSAWAHRLPHFLPDGDHFLFVERNNEMPFGRISVASLTNPSPRMLVERGSNVSYANGYLVYVSDGTLVAHPFDVGKLALDGDPVTVAENVWYFNSRDLAYVSASPSGILVYRRSPNRLRQVALVDRSGRETSAIGDPVEFFTTHVSADRRWAVGIQGNDASGRDAWVLDLERGTMTRSTFNEARSSMTALCSKDCGRLAVSHSGAGGDAEKSTLWIQPQSGANSAREVVPVTMPFTVQDWSADDRYLLGTYQSPTNGLNVGYVDLLGKREITPLLTGKYDESAPRLSPDGKWLTYNSLESGRRHVYLTPFPSLDRKFQVADEEAFWAEWLPGGRELILERADRSIRSIAIDLTGSEPKIAKSVELPIRRYERVRVITDDRFLAEREINATSEPLRLVVNWTQILPQRED